MQTKTTTHDRNRKTKTGWRTVRLGAVSSMITKGTTPTTIGGKFVSNGINFIKAESISDDGSFIRDKFDHIDEKTNKLLRRSIVYENDILYSIAGVIGRSARVTKDVLPANTNQALAIIRPNQEVVNPKYLFYVLSAPKQRSMANSFVAQSVQANINLQQISDFEIVLPNIDEQEYIAGVLGALDEKIENNNRIIKTLEEMAQAIFKEWFVKFRFPGYEKAEFVDSELGRIPRGWEVKRIHEICDTFGGGTPSTGNQRYWKNGNVAWATPTDMTALHSLFIDRTGRCISTDGLESSSARLLPINSILMTSRATVGIIAVAKIPISTNQGFISIICSDELLWYFFSWLKKNVSIICGLATGSTFPEISRGVFREIKLIVPTTRTLVEFSNEISPIMEKLYQLAIENQKLATMRDLLLPRLMSGEIKV